MHNPSLAGVVLVLLSLLRGNEAQVMLNELRPNPVEFDPVTMEVELKGMPGAMFAGLCILSIEGDLASGYFIDRLNVNISTTLDEDGIAVVVVPDFENPSFTVVLSMGCDPTILGESLGPNDGTFDGIDPEVVAKLGTVYDAIGVPDSGIDAGAGRSQLGEFLGGEDFAYTGDEPQLIFRDGTTNAWYAINDPHDDEIHMLNATELGPDAFLGDPFVATFGEVNPTIILTEAPTTATPPPTFV